MAKQIASLISIVNPQAIVVISEKVVSLEKLNAKILKWIDNKHLPQIAMEKDLAFWVLCGLKRVCLNESVEII